MCSYKFAPGPNANTFIFPTDRGWLYSVGFSNRSDVFRGNQLLENNGLFFEIIFERSQLDKPEKGRDPLVRLTILTIITRQFQAQGILPIYYFICDMQKRQEAARAKLFSEWYQTSDLDGWELVNFQMQMPEEGETYYAGLFTHTEHPNFEVIPDAFEQFLEQDLANGKLVNRR